MRFVLNNPAWAFMTLGLDKTGPGDQAGAFDLGENKIKETSGESLLYINWDVRGARIVH